MHSKSSSRRGRAIRCLVVVVVATVVATLAPSSSGAQTFPWGTYGPPADGVANGANPPIVLVGDSLIHNIGVSGLASHIKTVTGRTTVVNALGGASWVNYGVPAQSAGNAMLWDYAAFVSSRLSIAALGTNDAKLMTEHPTLYTQGNQYDTLSWTVNNTLAHSRCVMLVNIRPRTTLLPYLSYDNMVRLNNNLTWKAATSPSGRVFVADWNAHVTSLGGPAGIYIPNDTHMTPEGRLIYAAFISSRAQNLINNHNC